MRETGEVKWDDPPEQTGKGESAHWKSNTIGVNIPVLKLCV